MVSAPSEAALVDAVRRRADALASADGEGLLEVLHVDFRWTSHRGELLDRATYVRANASGAIRWLRQSLSDVTVMVVEGTGVVSATVTDEIERDGAVQTYRMPMTQTWVHVDGRWQCLAGHAGPLL